tara:strand:+ start:4813 stop:5166 length:354 start_codon:yes stop_codon:yes gene_type:complete
MFRHFIQKVSNLISSFDYLNYYYEAFVHIIGIVIAAHVAAKAHPIKDHPWNMWYCIILFNLVYIITIAIDYDKIDHTLEQLGNPLQNVVNNNNNLINNNNLLLVFGIFMVIYSLYRR